MWVPKAVIDWFRISKESVDAIREDNAALRAENLAIRSELISTKANFNWVIMRVNSLEVERAQLLKKAYNVDTVVPEIVRSTDTPSDISSFSFEDVGDKLAEKLGLPIYGN